MRFSTDSRTQMKMLFETDVIDTISKSFKIGDTILAWHLIRVRGTDKRGYDVFITTEVGLIKTIMSENLDEVLDLLESTIDELAAVASKEGE